MSNKTTIMIMLFWCCMFMAGILGATITLLVLHFTGYAN